MYKVVYTPEQMHAATSWFKEGDLSFIGMDTETMGINWFKMTVASYTMPEPEQKRHLKERDKECKKEALDPKTNILSVLQLATEDDRALVIVLKDPEVVRLAKELLLFLMELKPVWMLHNAKFDYHQFSYHWGIHFDDQKLHDTQICEALIKGSRDEKSVSLIATSGNYSDIPPELVKEASEAAVSDWWTYPLTTEQELYSARDVLVLRHIRKCQQKQGGAQQYHAVRKIECKLTPRLVRLEQAGAHIDHDKLFEFTVRAKERQTRELEIYKNVFGDVEYTKPAEILSRIKEHYGVTPLMRTYDKNAKAFVDKESVDKFALLDAGLLKEPEIAAYITLKEIGRDVSYANKWLQLDGSRFFVNFFQVPTHHSQADGVSGDGGTRTGRMSTSPQLQNIPNFLKQFIIADEGYVIVSSDYSGLQLRLAAQHANVQKLKEYFEKGISPHKVMCAQMMGIPMEAVSKKMTQYKLAKEANFLFIFNGSGNRYTRQVLEATDGEVRMTPEEGNKVKEQFFALYPEFHYRHQLDVEQAFFHGFVYTQAGRRRYYNHNDRPMLDTQYKSFWSPSQCRWINPSENPEACYYAADWKWKNVAINTPIQGAEADGSKLSIIKTVDAFTEFNNRKGINAMKMFAVVHDSQDSIIHEDYIDQAVKIHDDCMKAGMGEFLTDIPVEVEHTVGRCWASEPMDILNDFYGLWHQPKFPTEINPETKKLQFKDDETRKAYEKWAATEFQAEYKMSISAL